MDNSLLMQEYDNSFSGEELASNLLKIDTSQFTLTVETVPIKKIGLLEPLKEGRESTILGLSTMIKELGVLTPIHIMKLSDESDISDLADDDDDDWDYIALDGLRRIYGSLKNGLTEIKAVVWDFKDKEQAGQLALPLSLLLNRTQRRQWSETWGLYQALELGAVGSKTMSPATLEYLLQLDGGDAMRLKDVMLCTYEEIKMGLLNNEKTLEASYKALQKARKEEDKLAQEDSMGMRDSVDGAEEITSDNKNIDNALSDMDVRELLEMANTSDISSIDSEDFGALNTSSYEEERQKVGERHPVDDAIRQGTFQRDDYHCRCCGTGGVAFLSTLIFHHVIPVHCKGADSVENGLTLCDSCHIALHCAEKRGGKLQMTEEQFNEYPENEQRRIKLILKYAKIAVEAAKRQGVTIEKVKEGATLSARHRMPGEGLTANQAGFAVSERKKAIKSSDKEDM